MTRASMLVCTNLHPTPSPTRYGLLPLRRQFGITHLEQIVRADDWSDSADGIRAGPAGAARAERAGRTAPRRSLRRSRPADAPSVLSIVPVGRRPAARGPSPVRHPLHLHDYALCLLGRGLPIEVLEGAIDPMNTEPVGTHSSSSLSMHGATHLST